MSLRNRNPVVFSVSLEEGSSKRKVVRTGRRSRHQKPKGSWSEIETWSQVSFHTNEVKRLNVNASGSNTLASPLQEINIHAFSN